MEGCKDSNLIHVSQLYLGGGSVVTLFCCMDVTTRVWVPAFGDLKEGGADVLMMETLLGQQ